MSIAYENQSEKENAEQGDMEEARKILFEVLGSKKYKDVGLLTGTVPAIVEAMLRYASTIPSRPESPMKSEGAEERGWVEPELKIESIEEALCLITGKADRGLYNEADKDKIFYEILQVSKEAYTLLRASQPSTAKWSDSDVKKFLEDYRVANMDCYLNPVIWFDKLNDEK